MTELEAIDALGDIVADTKGDPEAMHSEVDELLLDFLESQGFKELVESVSKVQEGHNWWCA